MNTEEEFIHHLRTGYPKIYNLDDKMGGSSSNDSKVVFEYIREIFRILFEDKVAKNIKVEEKIKLVVKNEMVYCSLYKASPISPNL